MIEEYEDKICIKDKRMLINDLCHINYVVSNMDRSLEFYRDLLGMEVTMDKEIDSPSLSRGTNLKDVKVRIAFLKTNHDNLMLELFEYKNPLGNNIGASPTNTIPLGHIAFKVKDIKAHYDELTAKGVEFMSEPQTIADGVSFCYMRDPDGALIELIEFPE